MGREFCKYCKKKRAVAKGLCRKCYARSYYRERHGIDTSLPVYGKPTGVARNRKTDDILYLLDKGMQQSQIAQVVECSRQWVSYVAKRGRKNNEQTKTFNQ